MDFKSFEEKICSFGGAIKMLRSMPAYTYPFPYRMEYTSWADEQYAWKHAATMFDQSHHMDEVYFRGPDVKRLCSDIGVNSFKTFGAGAAKQIVCCTERGDVIGDAILFAYDEEQWSVCGTPVVANWAAYVATSGGYDVEITRDPPSLWNKAGRRLFRYQLNGPLSQNILEAAHGGPIDTIKFFKMGRVTVAGCDLYVLNHTMSGVPGEETTGFELMGPLEHKEPVYQALIEAGRAFEMREGGARAYLSAGAESGWIPLYVPAIYTGAEMDAYREWLPGYTPEGLMPLTGSFDSTSIEDYYLKPWDLGYGRLIRFDHDFIGCKALEEMATQPQRRKVYLDWKQDDASRLIKQSLFGGTKNAKVVDLPNVAFGTPHYDALLKGGRLAGFSTWGAFTVNLGAIVTLGIVDPEIQDGDEVTIVWGEAGGAEARPFIAPHVMSEVRATVCSRAPLQ